MGTVLEIAERRESYTHRRNIYFGKIPVTAMLGHSRIQMAHRCAHPTQVQKAKAIEWLEQCNAAQ
jgi:hypothetical protein